MWKEGPQFLLEDEINWPSDPPGTSASQNDVQEESKMARTHVAQVSEENVLNPRTFSSLRRLVSITAWIKRFVNNCKRSVELRVFSRDLSVKELNEAETYWLKRAQIERFQDAKGRNSLENLNPIKDAEGLIRIDGRLRHADLPYNSKHPVILPKEHPITKLVIKAVHEKLGHGSGVEHTLSELRSRFWVIKGCAMVREVINRCQVCKKRFNAKPHGQMMAPLPRPRVVSSIKAFDRIGVDYGGPYLTKTGAR